MKITPVLLPWKVNIDAWHRGGVAQWVARLTRNVTVVSSSPIKGLRCFIEQETLLLLLSTGWFKERIPAWYHNRTKILKIDLNGK